ncbi:MAG: hypothetical protein Q4A01_11515 [Coriobacteriales bacterium]|nr:hypothetical protein [Coriobacteriales bacterium]
MQEKEARPSRDLLAQPLAAEQRLITWASRHANVIVLALITLLGILMRLSLRNFESEDYIVYLSPWYEQIGINGGLRGLNTQVGDYNLLYQTLIAVLTELPIPRLYGYKFISCCFDVLLAACAGRLAYLASASQPKRAMFRAILAYGLVFVSPLVVLNSAAWAQCDATWSSLCLLTLVLLLERKPIPAFVAYGFALSFKLQAVFFLPVLLYLYASERSYSLLCFAFAPLVMLLCGLPALIAGRSAIDIVSIYFTQTSEHGRLYIGYPGLGAIFAGTHQRKALYAVLKEMLIFLAASALLLGFFALRRKRIPMSAAQAAPIAAALVYTAVCLLPAMHQRYGYLYEVLLIVAAILNWRFAPSCAVAIAIGLVTYSAFLFRFEALDLMYLAVANVLNMIAVWVLVFRQCRTA